MIKIHHKLMWVKKVICLLLCVGISLLCGCTQQESNATQYSNQPDNITSVKKLDIPGDEMGINYGIINDDGIVETNKVYSLSDDEGLQRFINIDNYLGFDCEFRILVFVNYVQTEFMVEEVSDNVATVLIEDRTELFIPIEINDFEEGFNDVIILIVPSPNDSERSTEARFQAFQPVYLRCTVQMGNSELKNFQNLQTVDFTPLTGENRGIYINNGVEGTQQYQMIEARINEPLKLYITLDNTATETGAKPESRECVLILLKNLEQVDIAGNAFIYTEIDNNKKIVIPYEEVSREAGYSEYLAIQINRPYEIIDSYGAEDDLFFSGFTGVSTAK